MTLKKVQNLQESVSTNYMATALRDDPPKACDDCTTSNGLLRPAARCSLWRMPKPVAWHFSPARRAPTWKRRQRKPPASHAETGKGEADGRTRPTSPWKMWGRRTAKAKLLCPAMLAESTADFELAIALRRNLPTTKSPQIFG